MFTLDRQLMLSSFPAAVTSTRPSGPIPGHWPVLDSVVDWPLAVWRVFEKLDSFGLVGAENQHVFSLSRQVLACRWSSGTCSPRSSLRSTSASDPAQSGSGSARRHVGGISHVTRRHVGGISHVTRLDLPGTVNLQRRHEDRPASMTATPHAYCDVFCCFCHRNKRFT